jgi:hypothetical protein
MTDQLLIRRAGPADDPALWRLAALDSARAPSSPVLIAEDAGVLVAAVSEKDGRAIADPFRPTADVVAMLRTLAERRRRQSPVGGRTLRRVVAVAAAQR